MPYAASWTAIVAAISTDVVARLLAAGMPPLVDGAILLGGQHVGEHSFGPRIVMIPTGFRVGPRSVTSRGDASEVSSLQLHRPIRTQFKQFEVHVWNCNYDSNGGTPPVFTANPDVDLDWDAVDAMYSVLWQSVHALAAGIWTTTKGTIDKGATQYNRVGRYAIFDLELATPVLDTALAFAPSGVSGVESVKLGSETVVITN